MKLCYLTDVDVNECSEEIDECEQNCHNSPESYTCSCNDGFTLDANGLNCTDVDECALNTDGCAHYCHNSDGSYFCMCYSGYQLNDNGRFCDGKFIVHIYNVMYQRKMYE